jgi:hypothetical protein
VRKKTGLGPKGSRPRQAALIGLALVACLALAVSGLEQAQDVVLAQVSAIYDLSWHAIAGGGGKMESAQYTLHGTTGQAATGQMSSNGHTLCSGFWCSGEAGGYQVYLPLVLR